MKSRGSLLTACLTITFLAGARPTGAQDLEQRRPDPDASRARAFAPVQAGPQATAPDVATFAPGRFLVQLRRDAILGSALEGLAPKRAATGRIASGPAIGIPRLDALNQQFGVTRVERAHIEVQNRQLADQLGVDRWFMMYVADGADVALAVGAYAAEPAVEAATFDWRAFPAVVPNDPLHAIHWGHNNTAQMKNYCWQCGGHDAGTPVGTVGFDADAQPAWDAAQGYGSAAVVIAILDSGVDADHPDLRQVAGWDYGDNDSNPDDNSASPGHGTACAGVAAAIANNALGTAGAAGGCSIMPLKVADSGGSLFFSYIQNGLYHAADNGADVASMSFGAAISSDPATNTALQYAFNAGVTLLAATGNENKTTISYPANHANVIGVGAASPCGQRKRSSSLTSELNPGVSPDPNGYTCDGERWWGSNYGSTTQNSAGAVDLIAPTILPTTDITGAGGYASGDYSNWFNGTSCSTPYAAGVCALIESANPTWTPTQVRNQLVNTCVDVTSVESGAGWDRYAGAGMVNAQNAVGGGGPPPRTVTVTAPNGGEILTAGTSTNITWTSTGSIANVALAYSTNGGTSWTTITASTPNDGSQAWTVPSATTTQGRVRVSDAADATVNDQSNANFTIQVAGSYATLPYTTGFESGALDGFWTQAVTANGRVRVLSTNTPHSGAWHLVMDDATSGGFSQTEARLRLNLSGQTNVSLSFWWKDFGDETHTQDGIYFSSNGGTSYTKVYNLTPGSFSNNVWRQITIDLDALAAGAGLALTSTFVVKFQQYDDYPITTDGICFDDIAVTPVTGGSYITAESEANNTSATADGPVGSGIAVTGAISSSSDGDYFFFDVATAGNVNINLAIGSSADLDWFLYNSALTEVARGYTVSNPEVGNYNAAPGRYYLLVDGYQSATSSYTLTVTGGLAKAGDETQQAPLVYALHQNAPNPFNPTTTIGFDLPRESPVRLVVYDARGRVVANLVDKVLPAGRHALRWNGLDDQGQRLPSGMYLYRIRAEGFEQVRKMLLVK
jgi:subtilisin family serine protease